MTDGSSEHAFDILAMIKTPQSLFLLIDGLNHAIRNARDYDI